MVNLSHTRLELQGFSSPQRLLQRRLRGRKLATGVPLPRLQLLQPLPQRFRCLRHGARVDRCLQNILYKAGCAIEPSRAAYSRPQKESRETTTM